MTLASHMTQTNAWTRFLACADAYGAQRSVWPAAEQAIFDQFAATQAGREALAPARALDTLLGDESSFEVSPDFLARLQAMPLPPQQRTPVLAVVMWRRSALLLLLLAALGFGNGYANNADLDRVLDRGTMTTAFGVASLR